MARAALQWQAELGASDAVGDVPIDRYEVPAQSPKLPTAAATQLGAPEVTGAPAPAMTAMEVASVSQLGHWLPALAWMLN